MKTKIILLKDKYIMSGCDTLTSFANELIEAMPHDERLPHGARVSFVVEIEYDTPKPHELYEEDCWRGFDDEI